MSTKFANRFNIVRARNRRVRLCLVLVQTLLIAILGLALLALADFWLELSQLTRVIGVGVVGCLVVVVGGRMLLDVRRQSEQPKTAADIEEQFPELGQSVRTTMQFVQMGSENARSEGVSQSLVMALAERTHQQALPLELASIAPTGRLKVVTFALFATLAGWVAWGAFDWQWRIATQRVALFDVPYRWLYVDPGNLIVDEGAGTQIEIIMAGRASQEVIFRTRPVEPPDAEWTERILDPLVAANDRPAQHAKQERSSQAMSGCVAQSSAMCSVRPNVPFVAKLDRLTSPIAYQVRAGELESPCFRIEIKRPLRIRESQVELAPPTYTGQGPTKAVEMNFSALEGTKARFFVVFNKPVKAATIVLAPRRQSRDDDAPNPPIFVPLEIIADDVDTMDKARGLATNSSSPSSSSVTRTSAEITLVEDRYYSILAEAIDGTILAETKYRIRVRQDQPPQVSIESPEDPIEVHTLAELAMRVRVRDDYGLSKAGVVFQVNDEQSVPLIAHDFAIIAAAAEEADQTGSISPTTKALLEKVLPLEVFELTQKDSVVYFAFAEDNRPGSPQRTESDLRFIDIRPFKLEYKVDDPDPNSNMGMSYPFKFLEELIKLQRSALNRAVQIERRAAAGRKPDAPALDQLMKFQTELASSTRDTASRLESRGFDDTELFYQAEASMLAAVDSLGVGKWETATSQMKDALKALIEQRDVTLKFISKNSDPKRLAQLRQFDREQTQKLRRPKSDKEEAREIIKRLQQLVSEENAVADALVEKSDSDTKTINAEPSPPLSKPDEVPK